MMINTCYYCRMRVRGFIVFILFFAQINLCYSVEPTLQVQPQQTTLPLTTPQNIEFANCNKMFAITKEQLFYLTLASISANKFSIDEIQSANGYILFSAANRKYLATVAEIDSKNSILKITPSNNTYFFPPGILTNIYKYIELNQEKL